jgi:hypothetical protein
MWRGPETVRWTITNRHEAGISGHRQGASCTPPRRSPTRLDRLVRARERAGAIGAQARVIAQSSSDEDAYLEKILNVYRPSGAEK